jgi:hypothetical protein
LPKRRALLWSNRRGLEPFPVWLFFVMQQN